MQHVAALLPWHGCFSLRQRLGKQAANTRDYYFLSRWHWYEWLGVIAPLGLLWWFYGLARKDGAAVRADLNMHGLRFSGLPVRRCGFHNAFRRALTD